MSLFQESTGVSDFFRSLAPLIDTRLIVQDHLSRPTTLTHHCVPIQRIFRDNKGLVLAPVFALVERNKEPRATLSSLLDELLKEGQLHVQN